MRTLLTLALLGTTVLSPLTAAAAEAAPPVASTPAGLPASLSGNYVIDTRHASIVFHVTHMGFSNYVGRFNSFTGKLNLDAPALASSALEVTIDTGSVDTNNAKLENELKGAEVFDAAQFGSATFVSRSITVTGPDTGTITGDFTFHGVTKPVTLDTKLIGHGKSPMGGTVKIGFMATGTLKRSDFGVEKWLPMIGDEVGFTVNAEFDKVEPQGSNQRGQ